MKFFFLFILLLLVPLIVEGSENSTVKDLGVYDIPHPGSNLDYKFAFTLRGKQGIFLLHQCLEGREIVSVQSIAKNQKKRVIIYGGEAVRNEVGNSISCEQENWFVFSATRLEDQFFKELKLICVRNNLFRVQSFDLENWGVSSVANRCSPE